MKNPARKKLRPMLSSFVDGELSPQERMLVERHVASCKESADEVADMRALSSAVQRHLEEAAQEEDWGAFSEEVLSKVLPEELPFFERLKIHISETLTYQRSWVLSGASAAALLCVGLFMWAGAEEAERGYGRPHLSIQAVSAKGGKTVITHTETGDAVVWLVEEASDEAEEATPDKGRAPSNVFEEAPLELKDTQSKAGAL